MLPLLRYAVYAILLVFPVFISAQNCPSTVNPVVGDNGVTYLNACFAQSAGITNYTSGFGFGDCIDPNQINPNPDCEYDGYAPVCGCNNVTYANECTALAAGVQSIKSGPCNEKCYDVNSSVSAHMTSLNVQTGILNMNCSTDTLLVCGCDGITYVNPCVAQASGITFYTFGDCNSDCIDPDQMDIAPNCLIEDNPVCGCNNQTYANPCQAEAAGVENYAPGACSSSSWCDAASLVNCGDFLQNESTSGGTNTINNYPCLNGSMEGPDKIYKIHKTGTGDLQIGLEILTPGLDLDLFLLGDNCNSITCLKKSTSSNTTSNNEGILLEDAPIGIYYIVVDGQYANSAGSYNLEVSCGFLDCSDAIPISCGQVKSDNNLDGNDNVSLYTCGNTVNVENNGPEKVYTFSISAPGNITIE
ncbi:MAG: Kazal-type serine protease inhibitor domain-containing protein, partial [Bacteroidota bacterium]